LGADLQKVGFGRKYEFKPSRVPGPGYYDNDPGFALTKSRSSAAMVKGSVRKSIA
jgi:hypothetical protein